jgi:uncharacterized protein (TIGR00255 family)
MEGLLRAVGENVLQIENLAPGIPNRVFEKLKARISEYGLNQELDETRLYQEAALVSDRCDVAEEIQRLKSHMDQFLSLLKGNAPAGKEMDFLLQEMNREINTVGAKVRDSEIAAIVVRTKSGLERMREQVRNVE